MSATASYADQASAHLMRDRMIAKGWRVGLIRMDTTSMRYEFIYDTTGVTK